LKEGGYVILQYWSVTMMEVVELQRWLLKVRKAGRRVRFRRTSRSRSEDGQEGCADEEEGCGTDDNQGAREGASIGDDEAGGDGALATNSEGIGEQAALIAESTRTAPETMGTVVAGALDPETAKWLCGR
jgi:hypothetical protein